MSYPIVVKKTNHLYVAIRRRQMKGATLLKLSDDIDVSAMWHKQWRHIWETVQDGDVKRSTVSPSECVHARAVIQQDGHHWWDSPRACAVKHI